MRSTITINKIFFLLLSFMSGVLELGCVLFGIKSSMSVYNIIGLGLAYQIGNLFPIPFKLNKLSLSVLSSFSILFILKFFLSSKYLFLFITIVILSLIIQQLRAINKENVSTSIKRTVRILGFGISAFVSVWFFIIIAIFLFTILFFTNIEINGTVGLDFITSKLHFKLIHLIMLVHQLQYFTSCYFIILCVSNLFNYTVIWLCMGFVLSWLTYSYIPNIIKGTRYSHYLLFGHIYLMLVQIGLYFTEGSLQFLLWIITGFGSGTVFCITQIAKKDMVFNYNEMTLIENIGHVLGVIIGIACYKMFFNIHIPILISAFFSFCVVVLIFIYWGNEKGIANV